MKKAPSDPVVRETIANAQTDQAEATTTSVDPGAAPPPVDPAVHDAVVDAQQDAAETHTPPDPALLADLVRTRDHVRAQYDTVKDLPQYATEAAAYKARLDEVEKTIAGRA